MAKHEQRTKGGGVDRPKGVTMRPLPGDDGGTGWNSPPGRLDQDNTEALRKSAEKQGCDDDSMKTY